MKVLLYVEDLTTEGEEGGGGLEDLDFIIMHVMSYIFSSFI